jgi:hypothetical protein
VYFEIPTFGGWKPTLVRESEGNSGKQCNDIISECNSRASDGMRGFPAKLSKAQSEGASDSRTYIVYELALSGRVLVSSAGPMSAVLSWAWSLTGTAGLRRVIHESFRRAD